MRGEGGSQPICTAAHGTQINFGDLTPYLTYACRAEVETFEERLTNARREDDFRTWRAVLKKKVCFYLLSLSTMMEIF
jgi:hypothetical protein